MFSAAGKDQPCAYTELGTWRCSRSLLPPREQTLGWSSITRGFTDGESQICSDFTETEQGHMLRKGTELSAQTNAFLRTLLRLTKSTALAGKLSTLALVPGLGFTCCSGTCTATEAPDPTQPPPSRACCPH